MLSLKLQNPNARFVLIVDELDQHFNLSLKNFSWLNTADLQALLEPVTDWLNGKATTTQRQVLIKFCALGKALSGLGISELPRDEEGWQGLIFSAFSLWFERDTSAKLENTARDWNSAHLKIFELLRDATDLIPIGVLIPRASKNLAYDIPTHGSDLIGSQPLVQTGRADQTIVTLDLERSDTEYLDEIRQRLTRLTSVLERCCLEWWEQIEKHFRYGQALIAKANWEAIDDRISRGDIYDVAPNVRNPRGGSHKHFLKGDTEESFGDLLLVLTKKHGRHFIREMCDRNRHLPSHKSITIPHCAPEVTTPLTHRSERINWMLGNLSPTDYMMAAVLLTIYQPKFTPHALAAAKLADKNNRPYLESGDLGFSLRIDKKRVHTIKDGHLNQKCLDILNLILEMTTSSRAALRDKASPYANSFFLVGAGDDVRQPLNDARFLSKRSGPSGLPDRWIGDLFPILVEEGVTAGMLTLRKIRTTQGVLEWFDTRSIEKMARKLGNSTSVSITHYLPRSLVEAWYTRQIRQFQNIWLATSAAGESYLLHVTDFSTLPALHRFLLRITDLCPDGSSPLANELHKRLVIKNDAGEAQRIGDSLAIAASKESFLSLYLYKEAALSSTSSHSSLSAVDQSAGMSPNDIIMLSDLVKARAEEDKNPKIRKAHFDALAELPLARLSTNWGDLFAKWDQNHA
ncbi:MULTISPECIES: hypothetical protein [Collimonas]|uniref:Uncharacterized protein n=2 Tax=Collimonas TaxID=202907 RepID=A0A127QPJ8_9BURK|nr:MULTISPECIES: hypothetical protein [Collimonas]AMP02051.1 hypothetical protein CAter10_4661 [Collimonas arenae]AMP11946.1 hypothetical protein CAter282_4286 [Collimonas arenae]AMP17200.1 hypothetical protein CPter291_4987 [Collimonas pratensis]